MSTHHPEDRPLPRGLKIKTPGHQSQGLKIVSPRSDNKSSNDHQLKMLKPSPENNGHQLKIKSTFTY